MQPIKYAERLLYFITKNNHTKSPCIAQTLLITIFKKIRALVSSMLWNDKGFTCVQIVYT